MDKQTSTNCISIYVNYYIYILVPGLLLCLFASRYRSNFPNWIIYWPGLMLKNESLFFYITCLVFTYAAISNYYFTFIQIICILCKFTVHTCNCVNCALHRQYVNWKLDFLHSHQWNNIIFQCNAILHNSCHWFNSILKYFCSYIMYHNTLL